MADPAVISVVATGTVGVLGAALGALNPWFTRKSQVEERLEARKNDFRTVLDEAAGVLGVAVGTVDQIWLFIQSHGGDLPGQRLADDIAAVRAHSARLGVRLGPSDSIYANYSAALAGLVRLEAVLSGPLAGRLDARTDAIFNWRERIVGSYAAFQESASRRMGVP